MTDTLDPNSIRPDVTPEIPASIQKHVVNCMRVSYCMLGEFANTDPGENLDQLSLILSQLPAPDVLKLFRIFEVPLLGSELPAEAVSVPE